MDATKLKEGRNSVIEEYKLKDNYWLSSVFENRRCWILEYFKDDPLLGILRTTSWSESANEFFGKYNMKKNTLSEFYLRFETPMDKQRQANRLLNHECLTQLSKTDTPMLIEKDAAEIYTRDIFYLVREEIKESYYCLGLMSLMCDDSVKTLLLIDHKAKGKEFEVKHTMESNDIECSCKIFQRVGYLCRHVFFSMKLVNIQKIPRQHVLNRWMKNAEHRGSEMISEGVLRDCGKIETFGMKVNEIWFDFNSCMGFVGKENEDLDHVANIVKVLKHYLGYRRVTNVDVQKNMNIIERQIGSGIPEEVTIKPPNEARNKGCGRKRIKSAAEKCIIQSERAKRLCKSCNQLCNHD